MFQVPAFYPLPVADVIDETAEARSFVLDVPAELRGLFRYRAGQFVNVKVPWQGGPLVRSYSLSSSPVAGAAPVLTVKRVAGGRASNWLNDRVARGDTLEVAPPAGRFVLDPDRDGPLLLFAAGSGITPVISILETALATTGRAARLLYANRDAGSIIFGARLDELAAAHPERLDVVHSLDDRDGLVSEQRVAAFAAGDVGAADVYVCGPDAFMRVVGDALVGLGAPADRVFVERFTSAPGGGGAAAPSPPAGEVPSAIVARWLDEEHEIDYRPGETILAAALRAGIEPPYSCEEGYCSSCQFRLVRGRVEMTYNDCLDEADIAAGAYLACQSYPVSAELEIDWDA